ncbi:class I SAM-dependent methyltransferase [Enhydrobacter aerosaccus]|uniref:class I SAM-dependent methyltransferase n=1 Tax=Enhydrobacter aerosaccus TaxID=225324 RepID=UPI00148217A6|nr:rRNA adenine N-6-methyltransferase family protein [Enhydrobacter aerosaccus]
MRSWWRAPAAVGLPLTSSPWTARRLAKAVLEAGRSDGPIVELGAGTGAVTGALLALGCLPQDVVVVERDAELCRVLKKRFHGLQVLHGDALHLGGLLRDVGIASVRAVLSGLPMRAIPAELAARCYAQAFELMPDGGAIIQYTYGLRAPVDPTASEHRFKASFVGREWRNFPPMGIWKYRPLQ